MQYLQRNNCSNNKVWNNLKINKKYTHKLQLTTNLSNPKNIYDSFPKNIHAFIVNNQTTPTLNNPSQPQPTKFGRKKKKKHFPIYFFHEKQIKEKLKSLSIICFLICYTNDIYSSKNNVLRDQIKFVTPSG